jgi:uncharacterized delta-60 repeat protein
LIVGRTGRIWSGFLGALALGTLLLPAAAPAFTQLMVVQPDGKIVLAGNIEPEAASLGRLNSDGSVDRSFGDGGFVIDRRLPGLRALALQPDGKIVGAAVGGSILARYLPDGTPDPAFAGGGVGGSDEPGQEHYIDEQESEVGPLAVLVRPGGDIVVAGVKQVGESEEDSETWVRRYNPRGAFVETVGGVPQPGEVAWARLHDLLEAPNGSLIGAGSTYSFGGNQLVEPILARFLPGSGESFDPSFGGGAGLLRPDFPRKAYLANGFHAIAADGDGLLAAGLSAGTILLARFDLDGNLDTAFGNGGFAAPPIEGPADAAAKRAGNTAESWAEDVAVLPDGGSIVGGGTTQWGKWVKRKSDVDCLRCQQPLLARFDSGGHLDPSFGEGGLLRLRRPNGTVLEGVVEQVVAQPDGKVLVAGIRHQWWKRLPFVARLQPDGSYDPSFGRGGMVTPRFPCTYQPEEQLRRARCVATALVKLSLGQPHSRHPAFSLRVRHTLDWAGLRGLRVILPEELRLTRHFKRKLRVRGRNVGQYIRVEPPSPGRRGPVLVVDDLGATDEVRVRLQRGALVAREPTANRKLKFKLEVEFSDPRWDTWAGTDWVVRRVG